MAGKYWFANNPAGRILAGSETKDFGSIDDGNEEAEEVTVTGAALGDIALVSLSTDIIDLHINADVTAADTVTCVLSNTSGGALDVGSGTLRVLVIPSAAVDDIIADM